MAKGTRLESMSTRQHHPESIDRSPARTPEGVTDSVPGEPETFGAPGAGGAGGELTAESLQPVLHRLALAMPLATSDQPFGPEHTVYRIGGKMFAMYTEGIGYPIVNLKTDPEESEVLRRIYPSIIPAWHMNKRHWISVGAGEGVTERVLAELVEDAYLRVMYSLPKSKRPIEFRERPVPEKH